MLEAFFTLAPRSRAVDQYGGALGVLLFNGRARSLVRLLAVPQTSRIEDALSLGLAFRQFREITRRRVHEHLRLLFGPWANQEIVCVGENTEPDDFPPIFSSKELQAITQQQCVERDTITHEVISIGPATLYDYTKSGVSKTQKEPCMLDEILRLREHLSSRHWCTSADLIALGLRPRNDREFLSPNEPWILRNLTSKQFVRAEAIALKPEFIHGPDINVIGFGEVLLTRICWSSAPAVGIADPTNICRGVWAGHRFDITTLTRHQRDAGDGDDWVDVSDEVAGEIATIWRGNFGADWRDFLCEFG
ncbi:hypothetical protein MKX08_003766 [Trichoderma sp. CBMAI-0020]|nr:hypothetical protein MKX08_003766 [Trichoderma sp. CBMAI-0020]